MLNASRVVRTLPRWGWVALLLPAIAQAQTLPTGFQVEPVITSVFEPGRPVGFAPLPDGRFLIIERNTANVRLHAVGSAVAPVILTIPDVSIEAERGLLGIAVDPAWPARPYVYFYYTHLTAETGKQGRVTMYTASGDLTDGASASLTLASPFHLLTELPDVIEIHNGGTLRFGADDMLYLSLGDDGDACNAQDLTSLTAGILRMDVAAMPDTGAGPPPRSDITPASGNPFPGPNENERLHYAWGLRNPYRFTIDSATGDLVIGDVGLVSFEEINHVPYGGGGNYGWPHWEGLIDPGLGRTCGLGNTFTDPAYTFPHGIAAAIVAGPTYRSSGGPSAFPSAYDGLVFFSEFYGGWIRCLENVGGTWSEVAPFPGQPTATEWATGFFYIADFQVGTDGALYFVKLIPGGTPSGLYRIVPSTPVSAPAAVAVAPVSRAFPNPARRSSEIRFEWDADLRSFESLRILNTAGRSVRTLPLHGDHHVRWDGRDAAGNALPSGVYFYSFEGAGSNAAKGRVVLIR
ncbi:MAG: hypothetical protein DHS20C21_24050 [Gemmatimonadota bacterium]|nr:MAG: hypothetical protein DHS20C21_24050 [Gemmatimonadota bacterium]